MFTIFGAPRTKKTHSTMVFRGGGRPRLLPSKSWMEWAATAAIELPDMYPAALIRFKPSETIRVPVNCRALFHRDANRGDACGYYQGLADLLEKRGVVENDRLIVSWNGSRLLVDRENPRTEVTLEAES